MAGRASLIAACLVLVASGCAGSWHVTRLRSPPRALAARPRESIEVFTVKAPDRPFVELAIISSVNGLDEVSELAGLLGCDAVFLLAPGGGGRDFWGRRPQTTRATCLVYDEP